MFVVCFGFLGTSFELNAALPTRPRVMEIQAQMKALEFTSDHNVIRRDGQDLLSCGERYPDVEWTSRDPGTMSPITHTQARHVEARVLLYLNKLPQGTSVRVVGLSPIEGFRFEGEGRVSDWAGGPCSAVVEVTSQGLLPARMERLETSIQWIATVLVPGQNPQVIDLGRTGNLVCYLTRGTPRRTDEAPSGVTAMRLAHSYMRLATAFEWAPPNPSPVALVHALTSFCGQWYNPKNHFDRADAWNLPSSWRMRKPGASCISICNYCSLILDQVGMEGEIQQMELYASPDAPHIAKEGGVWSDNYYKDVGRDRWELFLVDDRNTRLGRVGGWGGMNHYEACIAYTWQGKTYYFPGGTNRVYDNKNTVLFIFRTLAWARWDYRAQEWQVMEVVYTYTQPGRGAPANCPIP